MKSLFDKSKLLNMNLKNRFIKGGVWEGLADERGYLTKELIKIYEDYAKGGIGTIITGYAFVTKNEQPNPGMMGIYDDSFITQYKDFTDKIHKLGSNIIMQIAYGGFMTRFNIGERVIFGPSDAINEVTGTRAKGMTKRDIEELVESYATAAERVKKSGFDGVEIHAAHGYLLSQFLSPYYNKRTDEYGGTIENRGRIVFEILRAIREKVGMNFPVLIKLNSADYIKENGLTIEESLYIGKRLEELGIDAIEVSGGNGAINEVVNNNLGHARQRVQLARENQSYFKEYGIRLAEMVNVPVILSGGNREFDVMDELLNNSKIEYFSLSRPITAEPDLINIWLSGNLKKPKCISCNCCYKTIGTRCIYNLKGENV